MNKLSLLLAIQPLALTLMLDGCSPNKSKEKTPKDAILVKEETGSDTTYVYDSIGGNIIFTIHSGTQIESAPTENPEWNEMAVTVSISNQEANANEIAEGETLTNKDDEEIGVITKTQTFWDKDKNGEAPCGILRGFIKKSDIDPNSILENILRQKCSSKTQRTLSSMEEIINNYNFVNYQFDSLLANLDFYKEEYQDLNEMEEYILEDSWLSDPGSDRLSLLFLQDYLIAIVHKRPMEIANTVKFSLPGKREMIVFPNIDTSLSDKLVKFKTEFYTSFFD